MVDGTYMIVGLDETNTIFEHKIVNFFLTHQFYHMFSVLKRTVLMNHLIETFLLSTPTTYVLVEK